MERALGTAVSLGSGGRDWRGVHEAQQRDDERRKASLAREDMLRTLGQQAAAKERQDALADSDKSFARQKEMAVFQAGLRPTADRDTMEERLAEHRAKKEIDAEFPGASGREPFEEWEKRELRKREIEAQFAKDEPKSATQDKEEHERFMRSGELKARATFPFNLLGPENQAAFSERGAKEQEAEKGRRFKSAEQEDKQEAVRSNLTDRIEAAERALGRKLTYDEQKREEEFGRQKELEGIKETGRVDRQKAGIKAAGERQASTNDLRREALDVRRNQIDAALEDKDLDRDQRSILQAERLGVMQEEKKLDREAADKRATATSKATDRRTVLREAVDASAFDMMIEDDPAKKREIMKRYADQMRELMAEEDTDENATLPDLIRRAASGELPREQWEPQMKTIIDKMRGGPGSGGPGRAVVPGAAGGGAAPLSAVPFDPTEAVPAPLPVSTAVSPPTATMPFTEPNAGSSVTAQPATVPFQIGESFRAGDPGFAAKAPPFGVDETAFVESEGRRVDYSNVRSPTQVAVDLLKSKHPAAAQIAINEMLADPQKFADRGVDVDDVLTALGYE